MRILQLWGLAACASCSFLSSGAGVLKSPVQEQCKSVGLKGCEHMADGVVEYVDGDKAKSTDKLKAAVGANNPDEVVNFAKGLKTVTGLPIPGVSQYTQPVNQVATLIVRISADLEKTRQAESKKASTEGAVASSDTEQTGALAQTRSAKAAGHRPVRRPVSPSDPSTDPKRIATASHPAWTGKLRCKLFGKEAACERVRIGPFVVTDVSSLEGCADAMFIGAEMKDNPYAKEGLLQFRWMVQATHPGIHGARYLLKRGEALLVAVQQQGDELVENPKCVVTWSGYRPDIGRAAAVVESGL